MSALPLSEPDRFTSLHRHAMLCQDGDDKVDRKVVPIIDVEGQGFSDRLHSVGYLLLHHSAHEHG